MGRLLTARGYNVVGKWVLWSGLSEESHTRYGDTALYLVGMESEWCLMISRRLIQSMMDLGDA